MTQLPDYFDTEKRVKNGTQSALDWFIWNNEPAGRKHEADWRDQLASVLDENTKAHARLINQLASIIIDAYGDGYVTQNDLDVANDAVVLALPLLDNDSEVKAQGELVESEETE